jgi:periplasmic divalent cation tolerance protein
MSFCVVFITAPRGAETKRLTQMLLQKKLAACVNIVRRVDSFFWWQGRIDTAAESLLVAKTPRRLLPKLIKAVKAAHSYEVCEVVALPIIAGNPDYLRWVDRSCRKG